MSGLLLPSRTVHNLLSRETLRNIPISYDVPYLFLITESKPVEKVCSMMSDLKTLTTFGHFCRLELMRFRFGCLVMSIIIDLMIRPAFPGDIHFYF